MNYTVSGSLGVMGYTGAHTVHVPSLEVAIQVYCALNYPSRSIVDPTGEDITHLLKIPEKGLLGIGNIVWVVEHNKIRSYRILAPVESDEENGVVKVKAQPLNGGYKDYLYLGDLGVPGYNYDTRPCMLFATLAEAQAGVDAYSKWQKRNYVG